MVSIVSAMHTDAERRFTTTTWQSHLLYCAGLSSLSPLQYTLSSNVFLVSSITRETLGSPGKLAAKLSSWIILPWRWQLLAKPNEDRMTSKVYTPKPTMKQTECVWKQVYMYVAIYATPHCSGINSMRPSDAYVRR